MGTSTTVEPTAALKTRSAVVMRPTDPIVAGGVTAENVLTLNGPIGIYPDRLARPGFSIVKRDGTSLFAIRNDGNVLVRGTTVPTASISSDQDGVIFVQSNGTVFAYVDLNGNLYHVNPIVHYGGTTAPAASFPSLNFTERESQNDIVYDGVSRFTVQTATAYPALQLIDAGSPDRVIASFGDDGIIRVAGYVVVDAFSEPTLVFGSLRN